MFITVSSKQKTVSPAVRRSIRAALAAFVVGRILYSVWAVVTIQLVPAPLEPDLVLRPYQGQPALLDGLEGLLLGPWQRFDTMHYISVAEAGYQASNSVFPPLYPLLIRATDLVIGRLLPSHPAAAAMTAALVVGNVALIAAFAMLHYLAAASSSRTAADRTITYLALFPTGFFLWAGYSESLFLLLAVSAIYLALHDSPLGAGAAGFLAALSRLTGAILVVPLAYAYGRQRSFTWRKIDWRAIGAVMPLLGLVSFLVWRISAGLPPIGEVYETYWYQSARAPGSDLLLALHSLVTGAGPRAGEISLVLDLLVTLFLAGSTFVVFRRLDPVYGLYNLSLLLFMLLPTSDLKPLYSFSRYALMFFPTFMLMGQVGRNPLLHRLFLYPSLILALFFSGQFFIWGWVA